MVQCGLAQCWRGNAFAPQSFSRVTLSASVHIFDPCLWLSSRTDMNSSCCQHLTCGMHRGWHPCSFFESFEFSGVVLEECTQSWHLRELRTAVGLISLEGSSWFVEGRQMWATTQMLPPPNLWAEKPGWNFVGLSGELLNYALFSLPQWLNTSPF